MLGILDLPVEHLRKMAVKIFQKAMLNGQYCIDAVVAVVNKDNQNITNMTQAQLKDIFTGKNDKLGRYSIKTSN